MTMVVVEIFIYLYIFGIIHLVVSKNYRKTNIFQPRYWPITITNTDILDG